MAKFEQTLNDLQAWRRRDNSDNTFSKNIYKDAHKVLDNNYDVIIEALNKVKNN